MSGPDRFALVALVVVGVLVLYWAPRLALNLVLYVANAIWLTVIWGLVLVACGIVLATEKAVDGVKWIRDQLDRL